MKVTVDAQQLNHACSIARTVIGRAGHTRLPALRYVQIGTKDGQIYLRCTNLEQMVWYKLEGTIDEEGELSVIQYLLSQFIRKEKGNVTLGKDLKDGAYITSSGQGGLSTLRFAMYPDDQRIPDVKVEGEECVLGQDFTLAFSRAAVCAAQEESRPVLTGICLEPDPDGKENTMSLAAADGFRLYAHQLPMRFLDKRVIVPARVNASLLRTLAAHDDVTVCINDSASHIAFSANGHRIVSQLVQGEYPKYQHLIPSDPPIWSFECSPPLLQLRASQLTPQSRIMRLVWKDADVLQITMGEPHVPEDGYYEAEIPATLSGDKGTEKSGRIAANQQYIIDALKYFSEVKFDMTHYSAPLKIRGDVVGLTVVIMPMFVQW